MREGGSISISLFLFPLLITNFHGILMGILFYFWSKLELNEITVETNVPSYTHKKQFYLQTSLKITRIHDDVSLSSNVLTPYVVRKLKQAQLFERYAAF